jgi:hypothetical protein
LFSLYDIVAERERGGVLPVPGAFLKNGVCNAKIQDFEQALKDKPPLLIMQTEKLFPF